MNYPNEPYRITHLVAAQDAHIVEFQGTWESEPPQVKTLCGHYVSPFSCVATSPSCDDCRIIFEDENLGAIEPEPWQPGDPPGLSLSDQFPNEFQPHPEDPDYA